jgi:serine/threonine protein kinase
MLRGPLDAPLGADLTIDQPSLEKPGTEIGPYKLLQQIGEGGFGIVFMAEQTEPVRRRVALKVIKPGMDSRQVIARFEAERQALAMMDHPNIAKVLDAGTTGQGQNAECRVQSNEESAPAATLHSAPGTPQSDGRPYFVMELVKGVPITRYCDEHHLSLRQRLELFVPICQAIQHAHQKGIIHRDVKPTNILVALYDGVAMPKVIDFGVAKATGPKLTEKTMFTGFGQLVGTLEYMSPEQAQFNQLDIDTRSDIYSLGVLLTNYSPAPRPWISRACGRWHSMKRCGSSARRAPKPSTKLSTCDKLPAIAANRGVDPARLARLIRGELDWIVMKCLRRTATAAMRRPARGRRTCAAT